MATAAGSGGFKKRLGSVTVEVLEGDIVQQRVDAIVNSSNEQLMLNRGLVSRAILRQGGRSIQEQCRDAAIVDGVAVTRAGQLPCRNILHVVLPPDPDDWPDVLFNALRTANEMGLASIAIPALGTDIVGNIAESAMSSARMLVEAVTMFKKRHTEPVLREIRIVCFSSDLMQSYIDALNDATAEVTLSEATAELTLSEATAELSTDLQFATATRESAVWWKLLESLSPEPAPPSLSPSSTLERAVGNYREHIGEDFRMDNESTRAALRVFTKEHTEQLLTLRESHGVVIEFETDGNGDRVIKVHGFRDEVMNAIKAIEDIFHQAMQQHARKAKETDMVAQVQWQYRDSGTWRGYPPHINLDVEEAYQGKSKMGELNIDFNGEKKIRFQTMKERNMSNGRNRDIQRVVQGAIQFPATWSPMPASKPWVAITLNATTQEYKDVKAKLGAAAKDIEIIRIDRIQNRAQFQQYSVNQSIMDNANPRPTNTQALFHGTSRPSLNNIFANGFNRAYSGKNAVRLGRGVYFAKDAHYSFNDTFAVPDEKTGYKYLLVCRVLVGEYAKGHKSYIEPPVKSGTTRYDSVVDDVAHPTIFVVFHDNQAYADYLIVFKKSVRRPSGPATTVTRPPNKSRPARKTGNIT